MSKNQNGFGIIGFLAIIVVIGIIGAVGWLFWQNVIVKPDTNNKPVASQQPSATPVSLDKPNVTSLDQ